MVFWIACVTCPIGKEEINEQKLEPWGGGRESENVMFQIVTSLLFDMGDAVA